MWFEFLRALLCAAISVSCWLVGGANQGKLDFDAELSNSQRNAASPKSSLSGEKLDNVADGQNQKIDRSVESSSSSKRRPKDAKRKKDPELHSAKEKCDPHAGTPKLKVTVEMSRLKKASKERAENPAEFGEEKAKAEIDERDEDKTTKSCAKRKVKGAMANVVKGTKGILQNTKEGTKDFFHEAIGGKSSSKDRKKNKSERDDRKKRNSKKELARAEIAADQMLEAKTAETTAHNTNFNNPSDAVRKSSDESPTPPPPMRAAEVEKTQDKSIMLPVQLLPGVSPLKKEEKKKVSVESDKAQEQSLMLPVMPSVTPAPSKKEEDVHKETEGSVAPSPQSKFSKLKQKTSKSSAEADDLTAFEKVKGARPAISKMKRKKEARDEEEPPTEFEQVKGDVRPAISKMRRKKEVKDEEEPPTEFEQVKGDVRPAISKMRRRKAGDLGSDRKKVKEEDEPTCFERVKAPAKPAITKLRRHSQAKAPPSPSAVIPKVAADPISSVETTQKSVAIAVMPKAKTPNDDDAPTEFETIQGDRKPAKTRMKRYREKKTEAPIKEDESMMATQFEAIVAPVQPAKTKMTSRKMEIEKESGLMGDGQEKSNAETVTDVEARRKDESEKGKGSDASNPETKSSSASERKEDEGVVEEFDLTTGMPTVEIEKRQKALQKPRNNDNSNPTARMQNRTNTGSSGSRFKCFSNKILFRFRSVVFFFKTTRESNLGKAWYCE